jgi:hypothetical protein
MIEQYCNSTTRTILLWMKLRLRTLCNIYKGQKKYPWSGVIPRSGKRQSKGDQLANFKQGNGDYGGIALV